MRLATQSAFFVRTAFKSMWRNPFVHVVAISALSLTLTGYGLSRLAMEQLDTLMASFGKEVELTVYLMPNAPEDKLAELEEALKRRTKGAVRRVSPQEALDRLAQDIGEEGLTLKGLSTNPLPWTIEVVASHETSHKLQTLAQKTRALPFVKDVDFGEEGLKRLSLVSRALKLAGSIAFALVFFTAVIVVSATLQLAIFARRDEIEIQKLVGGTNRFVRMPFLIEGALQGMAAALISLALVFALTSYFKSNEAMAFMRLDDAKAIDWPRLGGEHFGIGVVLGMAGSFIAVRRFLKV